MNRRRSSARPTSHVNINRLNGCRTKIEKVMVDYAVNRLPIPRYYCFVR